LLAEPAVPVELVAIVRLQPEIVGPCPRRGRGERQRDRERIAESEQLAPPVREGGRVGLALRSGAAPCVLGDEHSQFPAGVQRGVGKDGQSTVRRQLAILDPAEVAPGVVHEVGQPGQRYLSLLAPSPQLDSELGHVSSVIHRGRRTYAVSDIREAALRVARPRRMRM
jgi:hypothetical protein